jgi:hypothetical protein
MQCPHCGADVLAGNTFCQRCRKRVLPPGSGSTQSPVPMRTVPVSRPAAAAAPSAPPAGRASFSDAPDSFQRPGMVTGLAVLSFLGTALTGLVAVAGAVALPTEQGDKGPIAAVVIIYAALTVLYLANGIGLWGLKPWGRILQIIVAIVGLCGIPVGTILAIWVLVYMFKPGTRILFSGRSPAELTPEEAGQVREASSGSAWIFILIAAVLAVIMVLIIAAIAIPSLLRARIAANESAAASDLRMIVSAEAVYAPSNGQFYDQLACLMKPTGCIPGSGLTHPMLDPRFSMDVRHGYQFRFYPGPKPEAGTFDPARVSPTSITAFAVVATPVDTGRTGIRTLCTDDSGILCMIDSVNEAEFAQGMCPMTTCRPLGGR